jgi:parvulin-like peptidyl-prolyl isomerase
MLSEAIGAPFGDVPVGAVTEPVKTDEAVYVMRIDKRTKADSTTWLAQKRTQRDQITQSMRNQRVRLFLDALKKNAKIDDRRKQLQLAQRKTT